MHKCVVSWRYQTDSNKFPIINCVYIDCIGRGTNFSELQASKMAKFGKISNQNWYDTRLVLWSIRWIFDVVITELLSIRYLNEKRSVDKYQNSFTYTNTNYPHIHITIQIEKWEKLVKICKDLKVLRFSGKYSILISITYSELFICNNRNCLAIEFYDSSQKCVCK